LDTENNRRTNALNAVMMNQNLWIKRKRESDGMDIKTIKNKMLKWRDLYGQDIVQTDEIKKAKTKKELYSILKSHYRFLEDQNADALRDVDDFAKELGIDV
jgi:tyrosine-protein phosphatase YwqE